ncbi:bifunctional PIG-L family deacetylase/class I SAM-dependent methyltransferase [Pedobacter jejuensis]|uniref:Methyltransferase domain-containing protein n=1 Tax=Pedobacter jejuensis TaxID=1268550 RepID=A0A3N0C1P7_9SPHI|nr:bifunctional PIG-L family deacetylase/class I SAM-dependent methyltransferase [Pedobacter jejuensis]RNL55751.1 methyltransferase domain-containing protein [Pedobacter jejuensis]
MEQIFNKEAFKNSATEIRANDLDAVKRCLILVPHPDDESLACAGLICLLQEKGTEFTIILTTDGSRSHPNSNIYPSEKLAALRKNELEQALNFLNLSNNILTCYNSVDSAMPAKGESGFNELVSKLAEDITSFQPDLVLVPYELDPHRDHRATWQLLMAALEKGNTHRPKIWEYPIWLYENAVQDDIPNLKEHELKFIDVAKYTEIKQNCIAAHASQTTNLIDDDPTGFMLSDEMISNFTNGKEYFMERRKINPSSTLTEDYFDTLYSGNDDPWNFEKSEYEQKKYQNSIAAIPNKTYNNALEIGCSIGVFTTMLSQFCNNLLAMDISSTALAMAKKRLVDNIKVEFRLGAIPNDFPDKMFDLIVMSEVGYYLVKEDLLSTRTKIYNQLNDNGILLLVHWTHFVVDYPISGDDVHECFKELPLKHLSNFRNEDYRIDVFQKQS